MVYTNKNKEQILSWLKDNLNEKRYQHSIGCAECAKRLAQKYSENEEKAYIAGLLHDCAKCFSDEKSMEIINTAIMSVDKTELVNHKTLHAPVSAYVAKTEFGVTDAEIISAIRWHTLGKLEMTTFEKIIFIADKIEARTREEKHREKILPALSEDNGLDKALLICYKETIKSLVKRDLKICKHTIDIYNQLEDKLK